MGRTSRLIAVAFALAWLAVCAAVLASTAPLPSSPVDLLIAAALVIVPPLSVWSACVAAAGRPGHVAAAADEGTMAAAAARLEAMHGILAADFDKLSAASDALEHMSVNVAERMTRTVSGIDAATQAAAAHGGVLDRLSERAAGLRNAVLSDAEAAADRLSEQETALAALWSAHDERHTLASAQTAELCQAVEKLTAERAAFRAQLEVETSNLHALAAAVLERTDVARAGLQDGVANQGERLGAEVDRVRTAFAALANEGRDGVTRQITDLIAAAEALTTRLAAQERQALGLVNTVERGFSILDARLAHAASGANTTLDELSARLEHTRGTVQALGEPLIGVGSNVQTLSAALEGARAQGLAVVDLLASAIPARSEAAQSAAAAIEAAGVSASRAGADGLAAIADASRHAAALAAGLEQVRSMAAETEASVEHLSVGVLANARATHAQIAGGHRDALQQALVGVEDAAGRAADAAQTAVERITQSLSVLARAVTAAER